MNRAFALGLVLLAGCATTSSGSGKLERISLRFEATAPLPSGWKHLATSEFELFTDLDDAEAQRGALLLTQSLEGLAALFGSAKPLIDRKLIVIVFADSLEFERRYGANLWGFAATTGMESTVVLYGAPDRWFVRQANLVEATHSVLQHELAHAVLYRYFAQQPTWFAEGMAQYLETFRWLDPQTVLLGEPNLKAWSGYAKVRSLTMKDLLAWHDYEQRQLETAGLYGLAWAFVHYALNVEPARFAQLMAALVEGDQDAFLHTFGAPTEALDQAVFGYLKRGQYTQLKLKVPTREPRAVTFEATPEPTERLRRLGGGPSKK